MARYNKKPNIIEMLATIFIALVFFLGNLFYKLVKYFFWRGVKISKDLYQIKPSSDTPKIEPKMAQVTSNTEPKVNPDNTVVDNRYELKECLLTQSEKNFLYVLEQVVGDRYIIEKQVQLSRIIGTKDTNNYSDFNRIKAKSIDFVLFNKDYSPYLCIELDDLSHMRWDRQKRDAFVDKIMKDVGLRIIHIRASYHYNTVELQKIIFK
jgi:very-short-patch-repair endonuclease